MLDFIYYPVSAILWFWHEVFGYILAPDSGIAWALSVVFLVFTVRTILLKPFISQVRSMRKMQEFAPEIQKLKKKYGNDRQKMAAEMQKLQGEHGVNPMGGCLPMLVQIPVFIGIFHVLRSFDRTDTFDLTRAENRQIPNYVFSPEEVQAFLDARLFGVPISGRLIDPSKLFGAADVGPIPWEFALVTVPLTILAGILTHITARHSVARQSEAQAANPQAAIMNKVMLYMFPLGIVIGGPFFPLGIILYWLSNNTWTLGQQHFIYKRIDAEEAEKKEKVTAERQNLGPRPGQKPQRTKKGGGAAHAGDGAHPGGSPSAEAAVGASSESTAAGPKQEQDGGSRDKATQDRPRRGSNNARKKSGSSGNNGSSRGGRPDVGGRQAVPGNGSQPKRQPKKSTRKRR